MHTPIVLVTGTIGSGKTSLVEAISDVLDERGLHHAFIELGATIERPEQLERLRTVTGATDLTVVLVKASPETVRDRIVERETGSRLVADFLKRTEKMARMMEESEMHDLVVWNEERPIEEIAAEVVAFLHW